MLPKTPTLPLLEASHRAGVEVDQIRRWAAAGVLEIHRRGGVEVVPIDQVIALASSARRRDPSTRRDSLRARLADARVQNATVTDLQQAVRDRNDRAR